MFAASEGGIPSPQSPSLSGKIQRSKGQSLHPGQHFGRDIGPNRPLCRSQQVRDIQHAPRRRQARPGVRCLGLQPCHHCGAGGRPVGGHREGLAVGWAWSPSHPIGGGHRSMGRQFSLFLTVEKTNCAVAAKITSCPPIHLQSHTNPHHHKGAISLRCYGLYAP